MTQPPHPSRCASHLLPQGQKDLSRRHILAAAPSLALMGCSRAPTASPVIDLPSLKSTAPFPVGVCAMTGHLDDPAWVDLVSTHFSQLTPEWEMKMERLVRDDGTLDFTASDRLADFCADQRMRLFGHTLIWYAQEHPWFQALPEDRFATEHDRYVRTTVERYRGRAVGWDVVNEPVAEDGNGYRECLWSRRFGGVDGYIRRAFDVAREADGEAVLFLNDYNLENNPTKGASYLRLVERLLAAGTPITGLGTQSHLDITIPEGQITAFMRELAGFGLPIHVSELDASLESGRRVDVRSDATRESQQRDRVVELAEAFMALPPAQRWAFTVWGARDSDSWMRRREDGGGPNDRPLLFDDRGRPKPVAADVAQIFAGG